MSKRILTIQVEVEQPESNWIWESHLNQAVSIHGCKVQIIAEGTLEKHVEQYYEEIEDAILNAKRGMKW